MTIDDSQTHPSLLLRLRDLEDAAAWERFVDLYTPLVFQFARKRGLQEADAADVTQEVMKAVAAAIQKFEYEWNHEYRLRMFHWAAETVRGEFRAPTWEAFWQTAVLNRPVGDVARGLGLSEGAVYIARSRVIARLRAHVEAATGDWADLEVAAA